MQVTTQCPKCHAKDFMDAEIVVDRSDEEMHLEYECSECGHTFRDRDLYEKHQQ